MADKDPYADLETLPGKPWWLSRGSVGAAVTIIAGLAGIAGYTLDAEALTALAVPLITVVFGIISLIGNTKRKERIDETLVAPGVRLPPAVAERIGLQPPAVPANNDAGAGRDEHNPFLDH